MTRPKQSEYDDKPTTFIDSWVRQCIETAQAPLRESIACGLEQWARELESLPGLLPDSVRAQADDRALVLRDAAARVRGGEWG